MSNQIPPKVLVKTWLELATSSDVAEARKQQIVRNVCRIFGSIELAEVYLSD